MLATGRRSVVAFLLVTVVAFGCCLVSAAGAAPRDTSKIPAGVTLAVGDQGQFIETALRASGQLDDVPYKVEFKTFLSGPLLVQGFTAGEIDLGLLGDTPAANAVGAKVPVRAVAVQQANGPQIALVARPGITSLKQLRGKNVAFTTGTAQHAFALRALKKGGLQAKDVTQVNVALQQLGTVLDAGQADASVVSAADQIRYLAAHPDAKVLADNTNVQPASYTYYVAGDDALGDKGKSAAIFDFVQRIVNANEWRNTHPSDWVDAYYVKVTHQDPKFAAQLNKLATTTFVPITDAVRTALQQMVDLEASQGAVPSAFSVKPLFSAAAIAKYNAIVEKQAP
jgi:sulfonate transport system substrate-binding protein